MKSSIAITAGAVVLGIVGIFATKPAKKFATFNVKFTGSSVTGVLSADNSIYTTVQNGTNSRKTVLLKTANNPKIATLVTNTNGVHRIYKF